MVDFINVYTDGSCFNNGKTNAKGSIGVFFGDGDNRNLSLIIDNMKITNQTMELIACIKALDLLKENENAYIYTDSMYVKQCVTQWFKLWE